MSQGTLEGALFLREDFMWGKDDVCNQGMLLA